MKLSVVSLSLCLLVPATSADLFDAASGAIASCVDCLSGNGDGECSDECDVISEVDDQVNECCDWWSCSSCPPAKATLRPKPPATTTMIRESTTPIYDSTSTAMSTTTTTTTTTTTSSSTLYDNYFYSSTTSSTYEGHLDPNVSTDTTPVAVVFAGEGCTGASLTLRVMDFVGGRYNSAWDACNAVYDDGSAIKFQPGADGKTFLKSLFVLDGYTVSTSTQCRDDGYWQDSDRADDDVQDIVTAESGCVTADYSFKQVDYNPPVAVIYEEPDCGGESLKLFVQDFVGGNGQFGGDTAWDACNAKWGDGTDITYNSGDHTWLGSIEVFPGFIVTTATQCNDDFTYSDINYMDNVVQSDGCFSADYDFNHLDFAVADGSIASGDTTRPFRPLGEDTTTTGFESTTTTGRTTTGFRYHAVS